jgi:nicotinamidase-related amidase
MPARSSRCAVCNKDRTPELVSIQLWGYSSLAAVDIRSRIAAGRDTNMSEWKLVGKPALILIHMQQSLCDPQGSLAFLGHAQAVHESGIIPNQQRLLKAFRARKLPVIYIVTTHDMSRKETAPVLGKFWEMAFSGINLPDSEDVEVIRELTPEQGEPVIGNFVFSIFGSNNLDRTLKELGVKTLVIAGVSTAMAVIASCWNAAELNYNLVVSSDGCTGADYAIQNAALKIIDPIAIVTPTDDVVTHLDAIG